MRIDFTGVEGQKSFEPIPAGKYLLEVTDYREGTASQNAKNAGAPTISWEMTVTEDGANPEETWGRKVWDNMTIVQNSLWRLRALLEACGFEVEENEIDFDPDEVVGSTFEAKVGVQKARKNKETGEEYDARNVIRRFMTVEGDSDNE